MTKLLRDIFFLGLPLAEKILRPIHRSTRFWSWPGLRLAGKRELAQLNPVDLVVLFDALEHRPERAIITATTTA